MAEFKFNCPQCGQPIEADESFRGETVECPHCGKGIVVPRATTNREKSPKLRRIRQKSTTDSSAGLQPTSIFMQANENEPSDVQSHGNLPPVDNDEQETMRNDAGMVVNLFVLFFVLLAFVVGGGMFVASRCDKKYTALRSLIEQTRDRPNEKASQMSGTVSEMSDSIKALKETHAALSKNFANLERRMTNIEAAQKQYGEDLANQSEMLKKRCASLLERVESLSQQVSENSSSVRQLEQDKPSVQLPMQPQVIAQNEPDDTEDSSEDSLADLKKRLNSNLAEIKELVKKNPACYLNPKTSTIINRENKIATMKDRRYCACVNVTFVRDAFYCSGCKQITPYGGDRDDYNDYGRCKVCRQMSFYRWLEARKKVDETAEINARIDELYAENESLEKQIRSMKRSRPRK